MRAVARDGRRLRGNLIDARVAVRREGPSRVGFVVPKHGQSAVRRNRLKRVLRELTRVRLLEALRRAKAGSAVDVVIRALPRAYHVTAEELQAAFDELRQRLLRSLESRGGGSRVAGSAGRPPE